MATAPWDLARDRWPIFAAEVTIVATVHGLAAIRDRRGLASAQLLAGTHPRCASSHLKGIVNAGSNFGSDRSGRLFAGSPFRSNLA